MNNLNFLKRPTILPIFHLMSKKSCGQKSLYSCQKSRLWCCRHTRIDLHFQMQSSTSHSKCTDLRWRPFSLINLIFYLTSVLVMILNFFFMNLISKKSFKFFGSHYGQLKLNIDKDPTDSYFSVRCFFQCKLR